MLQPGSEFGEGGAPASPKRVRTAKRLGGRRKESLQEEQDLEEEEEELDSDPEAAAAQNQSKGKRGRRLDPAAQAAKLAAAREKNRLAQQRFRERQRIKQKVAGAQCIVVAKHIEELRTENELLQRQNSMYVRVLAVRDAMLRTLTTLEPAAQAEAGQAQLAAAAAQGLAQALDALPTEDELEDAAPVTPVEDEPGPSSANGAAPAAAPASRNADSSGSHAANSTAVQSKDAAEAQTQQSDQPTAQQQQQQQQQQAGQGAATPPDGPPQTVLGEAHRTGTAGALDGGALQGVELIPAPDNQAVRALIAKMNGPDDLLAFVREWQADLCAVYPAAEAGGFDSASVEKVEATIDRMTNMWWHVGQLQPAWLSALAFRMYPDNSGQLPLWREIAAEVLPELNERSRALVRRSWHQYCKRMAKTAVGAGRWVRRLQEFTLQPQQGAPLSCMSAHATQSLELAEIASHIKAAVQEEYVASMEFVAAQFPVSSTLLKAYVNYRSVPWLPDLVAIVWNMLALDAEERQAAGHAAQGSGRGDLGCVPQPGVLPPPPPRNAARQKLQGQNSGPAD